MAIAPTVCVTQKCGLVFLSYLLRLESSLPSQLGNCPKAGPECFCPIVQRQAGHKAAEERSWRMTPLHFLSFAGQYRELLLKQMTDGQQAEACSWKVGPELDLCVHIFLPFSILFCRRARMPSPTPCLFPSLPCADSSSLQSSSSQALCFSLRGTVFVHMRIPRGPKRLVVGVGC